MDDSRIREWLKDVLSAGGVVYSLAYRIDSEGRECFVDGAGYEFCWRVLPMEFTFEETVALGTPTLPSLEIIIRDPESDVSARMELPMPYAELFLRSALEKLRDEYLLKVEEISGYVRMNAVHTSGKRKVDPGPKKKEPPEVMDDERYLL